MHWVQFYQRHDLQAFSPILWAILLPSSWCPLKYKKVLILMKSCLFLNCAFGVMPRELLPNLVRKS